MFGGDISCKVIVFSFLRNHMKIRMLLLVGKIKDANQSSSVYEGLISFFLNNYFIQIYFHSKSGNLTKIPKRTPVDLITLLS